MQVSKPEKQGGNFPNKLLVHHAKKLQNIYFFLPLNKVRLQVDCIISNGVLLESYTDSFPGLLVEASVHKKGRLE